MEKRYTLDVEKLRGGTMNRWERNVSRISGLEHRRKIFKSFPSMDGTTSGCSQQRNKFPSCLAFLFNDEDSTRRGTRKEGRVKKKRKSVLVHPARPSGK